MRRLVLPAAVALLALVGTVSTAQAQKLSAAQCNAMLETADDARLSLAQMETILAELETESAAFTQRILELQVDIRFAKMASNDKQVRKLTAEKTKVEQDLQSVELLRPDIATQVAALRDSVASADHEYIACIEQTISG
jgi:chromosome segregation ATPase